MDNAPLVQLLDTQAYISDYLAGFHLTDWELSKVFQVVWKVAALVEVGHKANMVVVDDDLDELQSILAFCLGDELQNFNLSKLFRLLFAASTGEFSV